MTEPSEPTQEFTIARALHPLSDEDEVALCAFVAEAETMRQSGLINAWRITFSSLGGQHAWLEVRVSETESIMGDGASLSEACSALSKALIASALLDSGPAS